MQLFFTIQPEQALVIDRMTLSPQQNMQPAIAEAPSLMGQSLHTLAQIYIVDPHGLIARRWSGN